MAKVLGICNLHRSPDLGLLTEHHPIGAITFLGRYGLIDFTLSNFSNSDIDQIAVLVEKHMNSMRNHIGDGQIWVNNTKMGFFRLFLNEKQLSNHKFNTDVHNLLENISMLKESDAEYIVYAPSHFIMSCNFKEAINEHISSNADISVFYTHDTNATEKYPCCDQIKFKKNGAITDVSPLTGESKIADVCLETFIISRNKFFELLEKSQHISSLYSLFDLIKYEIAEKTSIVRAYKFNGDVFPILSLESYVKESFKLLDYHERKKLFKEDWPIYTTTHNTPPSYYSPNAKISNSFVANGAIILGDVSNSIISREVIVSSGTKLDHCIIFTGTHVSKDAVLQYVLTDKYVSINSEKKIVGSDDEIIYINTGDNV